MAIAAGTVLLAVGMVAAQDTGPSAMRALDTTSVAAGGGPVVATITVSGATQGVVTETLPAGFTYVRSSLPDSQVRPDPDDSQRIRFILADSSDNPFTYTVTVSQTGTIPDGTLTVDRVEYDVTGDGSVTIQEDTGQGADPSATRALGNTSVAADGGSVVATMTITVSGATQGVVTETLPAGFTYVRSSLPDSQVRPDPDDSQIIRFILADSADNPFTYTVTATQTGTISDGKLTVDRVEYDVTGDASVTVEASAGPSASRTFDTQMVAAGGGQVVATITVSGATQGVVTEPLPAGFTYVRSSLPDSQVRPDPDDGQRIRFILADSDDNPFTYTMMVTQTGTISDGKLTVDRVEYDVTGDASVTVEASTGPRAVRALSTTSVAAGGGQVVATITVSGATQGVVTEPLPAGFTYVRSSLPDSQVRPDPDDGQRIRFILADSDDNPFTYTVTATQTGTISDGKLTVDRMDYPVTGPGRVTVGSQQPPQPPPATSPPSVATPVPSVPDNLRPLFVGGIEQERSVDEGSAEEANVGDPVAATDRNGDDVTYSMSGNDASLFDIDSSTGQIKVGAGTALDYETRDSYSVVVRASDPTGAADIATVTISVTYVEEVATATPEPTATTPPPATATPVPTATTPPTATAVPTEVPTPTPPPTATTRPTATTAPTATTRPTATTPPPAPTATSAATMAPTAMPEPTEAPTPAPTATSAPVATATTAPVEPEDEGGFPVLVIVLLIVVAGIVGAVIFFIRSRR